MYLQVNINQKIISRLNIRIKVEVTLKIIAVSVKLQHKETIFKFI